MMHVMISTSKRYSGNEAFRLADHIFPSVGNLLICIPIPVGVSKYICIAIYVVNADIPMIIGLPDLRKHQLLIAYIDMFLV